MTFLFLADSVAMAERLLPAVDLLDEPGRTFRVSPRWFVVDSFPGKSQGRARLSFRIFLSVVRPTP
ncbi:DUF6924 domain-containing protein [Spirillospora sp. NPDC048911]|uniref:DUF6924 domain-containing protein n=1 Tax=Spirillospora sp. NPDC048911 TaxID=3364527 RepID=UPI0037204F6C